MSVVLLPISAQELQSLSDPPKGIEELSSTGTPVSFRPDPRKIRWQGYPTPLGRAKATASLILGDAMSEPLVAASRHLLFGLVAGGFTLQWVEIASLGASTLKAALQTYLREEFGPDRVQRIGIIREKADPAVVWGSMLDDGVPVLSGHQETNLARLERIAVDLQVSSPAVWSLLTTLKNRHFKGSWDPATHAWMRLTDDLLAQITPAKTETDPLTSARMIGPFFLPRGAGATLTSEPPVYLPQLAPGFVRRLADVLAASGTAPEESLHTVKLTREEMGIAKDLARINRHPDAAFGRGCVIGELTTAALPAPTGPLDREVVRGLRRHQAIEEIVRGISHAPGPSLVDRLEAAPFAFPDVLRAVAHSMFYSRVEQARASILRWMGMPKSAAGAPKEVRESADLLLLLTAGQLRFHWADTEDPAERDLVEGLRRLSNHPGNGMVGLLTAPSGKEVYGYMLEDGIPALAGFRSEEDLAPLRAAVSRVQAQALELLAKVRAHVREELWNPAAQPWMALAGLLLEAYNPAAANVDTRKDVRSSGPFRMPVSADGRQTVFLYWPSYAPGFGDDLARVLAVLPASSQTRLPNESPKYELYQSGGEAFGFLRVRPDRSQAIRSLDLGEGNLEGDAPERKLLASTLAAPLTGLAASDIFTSAMGTHLSDLTAVNGTRTVAQALREKPLGLSDIGRVAARYGPDAVRTDYTPAMNRACMTLKTTPPDAGDLAAAIANGQAFVLRSKDNRAKPDVVYCERVTLPGGQLVEPRDLSAIGIGLWMVFTTDLPADRLFDTQGRAMLETSPFSAGDAVLSDEHRQCLVDARKRLASVLRFLRSWELAAKANPDQDIFGLAVLSARHFAEAVLAGTELGASGRAGAERSGTGAASLAGRVGEQPLTTSHHGSLPLLRDPFLTALAQEVR